MGAERGIATPSTGPAGVWWRPVDLVCRLVEPAFGPPAEGDDWLALTPGELPVAAAYDWAVRPDCGAVVLFSGTVRDHAPDRPGVSRLTYEAYESQVEPRLAAVAAEIRRRWPTVGRIVLWHRVGELAVGESSVIVAVSSPHRDEAFVAARFGIDAIKASAPIWKREQWDGGDDWSLAATEPIDVGPGGSVDGEHPVPPRRARCSSGLGTAVIACATESPAGLDHSVKEFRREMQALSPSSRKGDEIEPIDPLTMKSAEQPSRRGVDHWPATSPSTSGRPTPSSTPRVAASSSTSPASSPSTARAARCWRPGTTPGR